MYSLWVAAGVRGHVASTDWVGATDPDGLVPTEFWGRLVATEEPSEMAEVGTAFQGPHYERGNLTEAACCAQSILDLDSKWGEDGSNKEQQLRENDDGDVLCCHDRLLYLMVLRN
jgi:hypothetical protein